MILAFSTVLWGYAVFVFCKRWIYNTLKWRKSGEIPTILVGNLTVGGTGKTPFIQFLIAELSSVYRVAVLSRGYGRESKGFLEVSEKSNWQQVGDEPLEIKKNAQNTPVFVCENRLEGIKQIAHQKQDVNCVLLDDGFQHLNLKSSKQILLCDYNNPYYKQFFSLPIGRLREFGSADSEADVVVFTKCPKNLDVQRKNELSIRYANRNQAVFFSAYNVTSPKNIINDVNCGHNALLVTAIASTKGIVETLNDVEIVEHFRYADHHAFAESEVNKWVESCKIHKTNSIIFTRKDVQRLGDSEFMNVLLKNDLNVFEIHTEVEILFGEKNELIKKIKI